MAKKKTPGLNTGSMADISFLLLTFFLLTSAINTDQGIQRRLPPPVPDKQEPDKKHERDVLKVLVNMYDQLLVNGEPMNNVNELKERTKLFISNPTDDPHMSAKKAEYIEELGREAHISKGVVSLQNDKGTSYKMYIAVQNQLAAAYNELREDYSRQNFGKDFSNLSDREKKGVQKVIPISVSEAEPSNYGGNR
jgi:biopolymer transport protein ExbD